MGTDGKEKTESTTSLNSSSKESASLNNTNNSNSSSNNNNNSNGSNSNNSNGIGNGSSTANGTTSKNNVSSGLRNSNSNSNSNNNSDPDIISPLMMAKFLESELKANEIKHCDTCQCSKQDLTVLADVSRSYTISTQTPSQWNINSSNVNEPISQLCLRCHSNLNSPSRTNSPYLMKLVKSSDSVISETKSSVSDLNEIDKMFTPVKKDDLQVNPILGHHRLCERTNGSASNNVQGAGGSASNGPNGVLAASILSANTTNGRLNTSTMLYPTTHIESLATGDKFPLDNGPGLNGNSAQDTQANRSRFIDGGGTGTSHVSKYEAASPVSLRRSHLSDNLGNGLELDEERKPLLYKALAPQLNLNELDKTKNGHFDVNSEPLKSPTSTCSGLNSNKLISNGAMSKSTISGSMSSVWSKNSSNADGVKLFENFNRNLIKTIKVS